MLNLQSLNALKSLKTDIRSNKDIRQGIVRSTPQKFGFVHTDTGEQFFLAPDQMNLVLPGDRIEFCVNKNSKGEEEAQFEKLLTTELKSFFGKIALKGNNVFIEVDLPRFTRWLFVPPKFRMQAKEGDFVLAEISRHPSKSEGKAQARITEIIGHQDDEGINKVYLKKKFEISENFSEQAVLEANALAQQPLDYRHRIDLTDKQFITIDSESARDLDDALYAEKNASGMTLWVAIADPIADLDLNSTLGQEIIARGTSVYLPGETINMMPEILSEQRFSLTPESSKNSLVAQLDIATDGTIIKFDLQRAIIHSKGKLSYDFVNQTLEQQDENSSYFNSLATLSEVATALKTDRELNNIIMPNRPDYHLELDNGAVKTITTRPRLWSHKIVEECMVAANTAFAKWAVQHGGDLFITHKGFRPERYETITELCKIRSLPVEEPAQLEHFISIMQEADKRKDNTRSILSRMLAPGETKNQSAPHFGMGISAYTTFTSPIRKALDLYNHAFAHQILDQQTYSGLSQEHISQINAANSKARSAANQLEQWLKCDFAANLKGTFEATIVQVSPSGIVARINAFGIDGFVDMRPKKKGSPKNKFDAIELILTHKEQDYILDQAINVTVSSVDLKQKSIRLALA